MTVIRPLLSPLAKKLALVLVLKLAQLVGLWWGFVREQRVTLTQTGWLRNCRNSRPNPLKE